MLLGAIKQPDIIVNGTSSKQNNQFGNEAFAILGLPLNATPSPSETSPAHHPK
jgi:hypothetical protein